MQKVEQSASVITNSGFPCFEWNVETAEAHWDAEADVAGMVEMVVCWGLSGGEL